MTFNFELADFVARLRMGIRSHYKSVLVRRNKLAFAILLLFYKNGLIRGFFCQDSTIEIFLKYNHNVPVIKTLQLITRPSNRAYWSLAYLSLCNNKAHFAGFYVVSTNMGLITSPECLLQGLSGEVLFKVST